MIDFSIRNGDLDTHLISGLEAKLQSINLRLTIQRGSFVYDEALGSRLYLLLREKPSNWKDLARIYVEEALEDEHDIEILNIEILKVDKTQISIVLYFKWLGFESKLEVIIDDEV